MGARCVRRRKPGGGVRGPYHDKQEQANIMATCAKHEDCAPSISRTKYPMVRWRPKLRGCGHMCEKGMNEGEFVVVVTQRNNKAAVGGARREWIPLERHFDLPRKSF